MRPGKEENTAGQPCLRLAFRPGKSQTPALFFIIRKKDAGAVLRNYIKRAARARILRIQERKKVDVVVSLLRRITWKEKPLIIRELDGFAETLR